MYPAPACNTYGNGPYTYLVPDSMLLTVIGSVEVVLYQAIENFTWGAAIEKHCAPLDAERPTVQSLWHMCIK